MKLLEEKKQRIINRIQMSLSNINSLLTDINRELIETVNENEELVRVSEIYEIWLNKL